MQVLGKGGCIKSLFGYSSGCSFIKSSLVTYFFEQLFPPPFSKLNECFSASKDPEHSFGSYNLGRKLKHGCFLKSLVLCALGMQVTFEGKFRFLQLMRIILFVSIICFGYLSHVQGNIFMQPKYMVQKWKIKPPTLYQVLGNFEKNLKN